MVCILTIVSVVWVFKSTLPVNIVTSPWCFRIVSQVSVLHLTLNPYKCLNQAPHIGTSKGMSSAGSPLEYINPFHLKNIWGFFFLSPIPLSISQFWTCCYFHKHFSLCCLIPAGGNRSISGSQWKLCLCLQIWCFLRSIGVDLRQIKKLRGKEIYQYYALN